MPESRGRLERVWEEFFSLIMGRRTKEMDDGVEVYHLANGQRDREDAERQRKIGKRMFRRGYEDYRKTGEMFDLMREAKRRKPKD